MRQPLVRAGWLLVLIFALNPRASNAQAIRGRLVETSSAAAIVGALVTLLDSAGTNVVQVVSGSSGRFLLQAPRPGAFTLRVLRIGFAPWHAEVLLPAGETIVRTLVLTDLRIVLPEVKVQGAQLCGTQARDDSLSSVLWDQARTALALADEAFVTKHYQFLSVVESWRLTKQGRRWSGKLPGDETRATLGEWPIKAPPPHMLQTFGFITQAENNLIGPTWYGPDAGFLLSEEFFAAYCFQVVGPGSRPVLPWMLREVPQDWVGLAFKPGRESPRSGIVGVLWLDRVSAELRRIEWVYSRAPKWASGWDAGGRIDFAALDDGGRIPQRWIMRVPVPEVRYGDLFAEFGGYVEWGGYVAEVRLADGQVVARFAE